MSEKKQVPTVSIFGVKFANVTMDETINYVTSSVSEGKLTRIVTANPVIVMQAEEDPAYAKAISKADLIVPDGTGVIWAASYAGRPLKERVAGFDLLHRLMAEGEKHKWTVFLLGTSQEILDAAASNLQLQYPQVKIVGKRNGFFGPEQDAEVLEQVRKANPTLLFVARGAHNQEPWISQYQEELGCSLVMGVGGSFDVISGKLKRAPLWTQKMRIEWLYRLLQEPKRWRRMLVLPAFVWKVLRNKQKVLADR